MNLRQKIEALEPEEKCSFDRGYHEVGYRCAIADVLAALDEGSGLLNSPGVQRAIEIVNATEWEGDLRVNMTRVIGAGRVLAKALEALNITKGETCDPK